MENKTSVAQISLDRALSRAIADVGKCEDGGSSFTNSYTGEHVEQLLNQMVVVRVKFVIYGSASEAGVKSTAVVHCTDAILEKCHAASAVFAQPVIAWAHREDP